MKITKIEVHVVGPEDERYTWSEDIPEVYQTNTLIKIFTDERIRLKGLELELAKLVRAKTDYFSGRMSQEELDRRGWEQFLGRLLKNEIANYIESDDDIIKIKQQIVVLQEKINYLDAVIRMINNRGFQIKNALDWLKFSHGNN